MAHSIVEAAQKEGMGLIEVREISEAAGEGLRGVNDAPALTAATVGIAFGQNSDITAEAAGAIGQEIIDVVAVLNALRAAFLPKDLTDFV